MSRFRTPLLAVFLATTAGEAAARQLEDWPYLKLHKHADVVAVTTFHSTVEAGKTISEKPPRNYLLGMLTTLKVLHVVKGDIKEKELVVVHYRLDRKKRPELPGNGPLLIYFRGKNVTLSYEGGFATIDKVYLVFLKKRNDGRFECVSGQIDPRLSVRSILPGIADAKAGDAQKSGPWPLPKLFNKADLVAVARFESEVETGKDFPDKPPADYYIGTLTTFTILHVLKGNIKQMEAVVFHFQIDRRKAPKRLGFGPLSMSFHAGDMLGFGSTKPTYLLFLKKRTDGRYQCVSGPCYSHLAVKFLVGALDSPE
jgi:hypothetical protein